MYSDSVCETVPLNSIDESPTSDEIRQSDITSNDIAKKISIENDNFTATLNAINDARNDIINKKSFLLFAKHYPTYHHYSNKMGSLSRLPKLKGTFTVLPAIKGHTLGQSELDTPHLSNNLSNQINTMQDLTRSILHYGSKSDVVWMKFDNNRNGHKLVRPGFSARRYMANLVRNLNVNLVDKLISEGRVLEKTIFQDSILLPHIRRRLSADLSRYPEPYRILKQMLISPGPLNEYSFIWKNTAHLNEEIPFEKVLEVKKGDIKIVSKKQIDGEDQIYEEVQYSKMSHDKKKTILSNLLLKSAMNHALKMKDEMIEHNFTTKENIKDPILNIHIPIIKFDMMEAVTDLLNKETLETLSNKLKPTKSNGHFHGQALRSTYPKISSQHLEAEMKSEFENKIIDVDKLSMDKNINDIAPQTIPNLTLRLHLTNVSKLKRKIPHLEPNSSKQSSIPTSHNNIIDFVPSNLGLPNYVLNQEAQANAFVERLKNKTLKSGTHKEIKTPYGKYRDSDMEDNDSSVLSVGDFDPTSSFKNWKYTSESGKNFDLSSLSSSGNYPNTSLLNSTFTTHLVSKDKIADQVSEQFEQLKKSENDLNRLQLLLSEHAETVAERVLSNGTGGEDFASDVNVAIMEILAQKRTLLNQTSNENGQIWNVDVNDLKNQEENLGMIKDIFKSLLKDQLGEISNNEDVIISPEIMELLQNGSKLALDNIIVKIDPITGKSVVMLKENISLSTSNKSIIEKVQDTNDYNKINMDSNTYLPAKNLKRYQKIPSGIVESLSASPIPSFIGKVESSSKSSLIIEPLVQSNSSFIEKNLKSPSFIKEGNEIISTQNENKYPIETLYYEHSGNVQLTDTTGHHYDTSQILPTQLNLSRTATNDKHEINMKVFPIKKDTSDGADKIEISGNLYNDDFIPLTTKNGISPVFTKHRSQNFNANKEKEFVVGHFDDTKDTMSLFSKPQQKAVKPKLAKQSSQKSVKKGTKKLTSNKKLNPEFEKLKKENESTKLTKVIDNVPKVINNIPITIKSEISVIPGQSIISATIDNDINPKTLVEHDEDEEIYINDMSSNNTMASIPKSPNDILPKSSIDFQDNYQLSDEYLSGDNEEEKEKKRLIRQKREAKRNTEAEKRRLEVEKKRKEKEELRKSENKRREMEESLSKKLEDERRQREENYRLKLENEKADELLSIEAAKRQEYLKQKQIERERKEKEEFNRKLEELKLKQAFEEQKRKEEQERLAFEESERLRIENEMISRMQEKERLEYLKTKAEGEERRRLQEEEERQQREEQARLALEEAQRIAQQQARERALLDARLNFTKGLRIENEGLKKFLNITPTFVWSYFEFLKILGLQANPTTNMLKPENS